jgi:ribosome biogenesis GTPase A
MTPFEKNLEVWRQLWRVLERSDAVVQVVDSRDPLFYRSEDLEAYARYDRDVPVSPAVLWTRCLAQTKQGMQKCLHLTDAGGVCAV